MECICLTNFCWPFLIWSPIKIKIGNLNISPNANSLDLQLQVEVLDFSIIGKYNKVRPLYFALSLEYRQYFSANVTPWLFQKVTYTRKKNNSWEILNFSTIKLECFPLFVCEDGTFLWEFPKYWKQNMIILGTFVDIIKTNITTKKKEFFVCHVGNQPSALNPLIC